MEYPEDTPVAACYHLTWPDQKIYRGQLKDLAKIVHDNKLTLTTMLVVGEAIDNRQGRSVLYSDVRCMMEDVRCMMEDVRGKM